MKLFLIGMPGSGKSTLGKSLGKVLGIPFTDLDQNIIRQTGLSIPELFATHGEVYFRKAEHEALKSAVSTKTSFVMATGGGTPCFHDNMSLINAQGRSIYLNVAPKVITDRVIHDGTERRPLFKGMNRKQCLQKIEQQLRDRSVYYEQANITLKGDAITIGQLLESIQR